MIVGMLKSVFHAVSTVVWPSKSSKIFRGLAGRECRVKARACVIPREISTVLGCRQQQQAATAGSNSRQQQQAQK
jgi:hypothetical protein